MTRPPLPIGSWGRISSQVLDTLRTRSAAGIRLDEPIFADTSAATAAPPTSADPSAQPSPPSAAPPAATYLTLRAARREAGLTRVQATRTLNWPLPSSACTTSSSRSPQSS